MKKLLFIFVMFIIPASVFAGTITDIKIKGNKRLHSDMVKNIISIEVGHSIDEKKLNTAVIKLYRSGFFSDVKIDENEGVLTIDIVENPIVSAVSFQGNDEVKTEDLSKDIQTKVKSIYNASKVKQDVENIKVMYKRLGNFKASVDAEIIEKENGKTDVVFKITEGDKAYIKNISIKGNESFSSYELKDVIMSKEYTWWQLLEVFDTYDEDRVLYDTELLRQFYINNGFLDFKVLSYSAKLDLKEENFFITYNLEEGKRYKIGEVKIETEIPDLNKNIFKDTILLKQGNWYSQDLADKTTVDMSNKMGEEGFAFVNIETEKLPNKQTGFVDIVFQIKNSRKAFINKVEIKNNTRTYDSVIRRKLDFDEQDIFNAKTLGSSEQKLMSTGFFETVKVVPKQVLGTPDKIDIDVNVSEKSTGELSLGAGWSSINDGFFEFGIKENNFMGKGQTLGFTSTFSGTQNNFSLSFIEPYLWDRDLLGGFDAYYNQYMYTSTYGYDIDTIGLNFKLAWRYNDYLSHSVFTSATNEKMVNVSEDLSAELLEGIGDYDIFKVGQTISYRDQIIDFVNDTRQGYVLSLSNEYAGFGGDKYFVKNDLSLKQTFSFWDNVWQFGILFDAGKIHSLNGTTLSSSDRYLLGADNLRGFEYGGVGARSSVDTSYAYGGNWVVNGSFQLNFPIGIPKKYKVSGYIFYDWGKLGKPELSDYTDVLYSGKIRTSAGYGISWSSPLGVINLSWATPLSYESWDELERFRFSVGSGF